MKMDVDERYSRHLRFAPIGAAGQRRLGQARVAVIGCGALGTVIADQLARAGVAHLRLVDRDFVEASNLQRQSLYDADDAAEHRPKAVAAARRLAQVNPLVTYEPIVAEVGVHSVRRLVAGVDLVLDGTDNFRTRHLLNEACVQAGIPWIYGACVGSYGCSLAITPGDGPCLACLQDELPAPGETPTCDTGGIIAPAVHLVAAWQVADALRILVGGAPRRELWACDVWAGTHQRLNMRGARRSDCPVCGPNPVFPLLSGPEDPAIVLCGRDAIQIHRGRPIDVATLAVPATSRNDYLVRWSDGDLALTAFADGRILVQGAADPAAARTVVDRWLG